MIQLTRAGAVVNGSDAQIEQSRAQFRERHFVRLRALLEPPLLAYFLDEIEAAHFEDLTHEGIGRELWLPDQRVTGALDFLLNDPLLLQLVETLTQCGPVGCFFGRVYRLAPGGEHYDSWHSDLADHRLVALSLNLSGAPYTGGRLQIRDHHSKALLEDVENETTGDAILFRLSSDLEHRVTPVSSSNARTAFAGWFRSEPDYHRLLFTDADLAASNAPSIHGSEGSVAGLA